MKTIVLLAVALLFCCHHSIAQSDNYELKETVDSIEIIIHKPISLSNFLMQFKNQINGKKILRDTVWTIEEKGSYLLPWPWEDPATLHKVVSGKIVLPKNPNKADSAYRFENILVGLAIYTLKTGKNLWSYQSKMPFKSDNEKMNIGYVSDREFLIEIMMRR